MRRSLDMYGRKLQTLQQSVLLGMNLFVFRVFIQKISHGSNMRLWIRLFEMHEISAYYNTELLGM